MTGFSREVSELGEFGDAANDNEPPVESDVHVDDIPDEEEPEPELPLVEEEPE